MSCWKSIKTAKKSLFSIPARKRIAACVSFHQIKTADVFFRSYRLRPLNSLNFPWAASHYRSEDILRRFPDLAVSTKAGCVITHPALNACAIALLAAHFYIFPFLGAFSSFCPVQHPEEQLCQTVFNADFNGLIILRLNLEIGLGMRAHRTNFRRLSAYYDMAAVRALLTAAIS